MLAWLYRLFRLLYVYWKFRTNRIPAPQPHEERMAEIDRVHRQEIAEFDALLHLNPVITESPNDILHLVARYLYDHPRVALTARDIVLGLGLHNSRELAVSCTLAGIQSTVYGIKTSGGGVMPEFSYWPPADRIVSPNRVSYMLPSNR